MESIEEYFDILFQGQEPETLYEPILYTLMQPGKRLRPQLVRLAAEMFDGNKEETDLVASAYEMLHNFTLIHDDIMDKAEIRRGRSTVHKKWNTNVAILSGDALVVMALLQIHKLTCDPETVLAVAKLFAQVSMETCKGQQYDLDFESAKTVTIEQYLKMIQMKTATMFAGCLKSGGLVAHADEESLQALYDLGIHLGTAFQLADDLLDVYADSKVFGKAVGSDIKDNKKTFIYLKAMELANESQACRLQELFSTTGVDEQTKFQDVKAIFDAVNVKQATEEKISFYIDKCFDDIDHIHVDEIKKSPVKSLIQQLKNRSK
ncbi:MAG: polyprenyl synthetase family protein [Bacteroidales bacterium]|nr:polyprenyl synthetase family protein [Bacteroidales bacterium]